MALTPETLTRHELNGLSVRVVDAANPDLVGIAGRVVVETMQTLHIDDGTRVRQVPKRGVTLEFALTAGEPEFGDGVYPSPDQCTDEAAGTRRSLDEPSIARRRRKAPGSTFKRESETAGGFPGQSGSTRTGSPDGDGRRSSPPGDCEDVVYVTVDGARLLSRPAHRTENAGDSKWR
ncbi:ribonuclease P protein subunit POP4 [Halogranum amylolyticum]|uniref:Ribonuclease P protein component 1 n=1 Tax=Halogranum amylolyticum TaxID=660520 RepID=A0A1H8NC74_9EURY|nr:ribonuclease P protein subunit [Halogranum amylolyticum]SEO27301.1 ribonuclease P protein subunit POP4 [Halogranum amylolyticum]